MPSREITFITSNKAKAEQLRQHLDFPIGHLSLEVTEIQSLDLHEVVEHKARSAWQQVQKTVLVEDTALTFAALGLLPGPLIKWFLTELDNQGLCRLLDGYKDRSAVAEVMFGLFDGRHVDTFVGKMPGTIAPRPRGKQGFGWDPIFIPQGSKKTWGEMSAQELSQTSMRRIALQKLQKFLKNESK